MIHSFNGSIACIIAMFLIQSYSIIIWKYKQNSICPTKYLSTHPNVCSHTPSLHSEYILIIRTHLVDTRFRLNFDRRHILMHVSNAPVYVILNLLADSNLNNANIGNNNNLIWRMLIHTCFELSRKAMHALIKMSIKAVDEIKIY